MKYLVCGTVTISMYTEVEANSPEEARDIANQRGVCSLGSCKSNGDEADEVWCHSGEIDGEVQLSEVEEM